MKAKKAKFEGKIEPIRNSEPFYMVMVENSHTPPTVTHENYEDAFTEAMRLAKKENRNAFVLISVSQIELIPNVTQFR
jgi:hypothetical protein